MRDIQRTLRMMMAERDFTITRLCEEYNERTGASFTKQSFFYKINHETVKLDEFIVFCDILGYDLIVEDKESHVRISQ